MKRTRRPLPIPQHEFGFAADTFRLFSETTLDGERLAHEQAEAAQARRVGEQAQAGLFQSAICNPQSEIV
ncbi:MAG: hypothetical protein HZA90_14900 [Verrucomicrobia bacterium]|nr:hypothetical protein [Verrucomicrobiota bacterium]